MKNNNMKPGLLAMLAALIISGFGYGCGNGWQLDYGKPEAQFLAAGLASQGTSFVGKKITVKGVVVKVDVSDSKSAWIHLDGGIQCNLGKFKAMAESCRIGDTVYVDGFLKRCEEGDILLVPALLRDPTAPFSPTL